MVRMVPTSPGRLVCAITLSWVPGTARLRMSASVSTGTSSGSQAN